MDTTGHGWRKSTYSDQNDCVEVRFAVERVLVRNSRRPEATPLAFTARRWHEFLSGLSCGEFGTAPPAE